MAKINTRTIKKDIENKYFMSNNLFNFLSYNIGKYII